MIIPHTSCNEGEGEKNIYSALQSTFLVPASKPADCKQSPDSASYHRIKKVSKQACHKKLITPLVFQVATSGSLPNFAGWSQISHKINTPPGPAQRRAPCHCTLSPAPCSPCPGCPGMQGAGRLSPPPAACRMHRDALPGWWDRGAVGIPPSLSPVSCWDRNRQHCPSTDTFSSPLLPRLEQARAGRSKPKGKWRGSGSQPWQKRVRASHPPHQESTVSATPCFKRRNDGMEKERQEEKQK